MHGKEGHVGREGKGVEVPQGRPTLEQGGEQAKEQHRSDKKALKRRREVEREEGHVARVVAWEEAAQLKELKATQQVEI